MGNKELGAWDSKNVATIDRRFQKVNLMQCCYTQRVYCSSKLAVKLIEVMVEKAISGGWLFVVCAARNCSPVKK